MLGKIAKYSNPFTAQADLGMKLGGKIGNPLNWIPQNNFQPMMADISNPTNAGQIGTAYDQTQMGLQQQQDFIRALQAQGGIQNQARVFNQQQGLAEQLSLQAQGAGPNPALAQFNQATGQNVANQAALMAGQRGSGANAGLIARQAAQQGANIQQQAAGQAAIMQANQQLAAQQALAQQQQAMAGLATNQVGQQASALQGYNTGALAQQQNLLGANQGFQDQLVRQTVANNQMLNERASANADAKRKTIGKLFDTGVGMAKTFGGGMAHGGMVNADGSVTEPASKLGKLCMSHGGVVPGSAPVAGDSLQNDTVPAQLSPGEVVIPRSVMQQKDPVKAAASFVEAVLKQKSVEAKSNFATGGKVGGLANMLTPEQKAEITARNEAAALEEQEQARAAGVRKVLPGQMYGEAPSMEASSSYGLQAPAPMAAPNGASGSWDSAPLAEEAAVSQEPAPEASAGRDLATTTTATGATSSSGSDFSGMGGFGKGVEQQKQGIIKEANALGELGKAEAKIQEDSILEQQKAAATFQEHWAEADAERKAFIEDFQSQKIDPNRYIGKMDTGRKIATGVGLILGGLGAAFHGGENVALKMLDKSIDNDIKAQEAEIGKKQTLLSMNLQQYGNIKDATNMTRIMMADIQKAELEKAAANSKDPIAQARAQAAIGEINQKTAPLMAQMAAKRALMSGVQMGSVDPLKAVNIVVPENERKIAREEVDNVRALRDGIKNARKLYSEVEKIGVLGANMPFSKSSAQIDSVNAQIEGIMRASMKGQGAITNEDAKALIKPFKISSIDTPEQRKTKLEGMINYMVSKAPGTPTLDAYGIKIDKSAPTMTPQQERLLNYARQNPQDPKSAQIMQMLGQ
jgi:hypothetical protein